MLLQENIWCFFFMSLKTACKYRFKHPNVHIGQHAHVSICIKKKIKKMKNEKYASGSFFF